jgi:hypothetical protein
VRNEANSWRNFKFEVSSEPSPGAIVRNKANFDGSPAEPPEPAVQNKANSWREGWMASAEWSMGHPRTERTPRLCKQSQFPQAHGLRDLLFETKPISAPPDEPAGRNVRNEANWQRLGRSRPAGPAAPNKANFRWLGRSGPAEPGAPNEANLPRLLSVNTCPIMA